MIFNANGMLYRKKNLNDSAVKSLSWAEDHQLVVWFPLFAVTTYASFMTF